MLVLVAFAVSLVTVLNVPWRGAAAAFEYRYTLSGHVLVAILLADAAQRARAAWSGEIARVGLGAAVGAYLVASADATLDNVHAWRAPAPYWVRNTMLYPGDYDAHYNAGKALARKRQHHAALDHLEIAEPNHPDSAVYRRLAESYDALGLLGEARANYLRYYSRNRSAVVGDVKERFAELGITDDMVRAARKIPVERDPWAVLTQEGLGAAGETGETEADAGAPPR